MTKRLLGTLVAVAVMVAAVPAVSRAGQAMKTMNTSGTVSAVTPAQITVKAKDATTATYDIDKDTVVTAKGASHKSLALKVDGKASVLTEFVKVGDTVSVGYHDMGGSKHAATINVTAAAK